MAPSIVMGERAQDHRDTCLIPEILSVECLPDVYSQKRVNAS